MLKGKQDGLGGRERGAEGSAKGHGGGSPGCNQPPLQSGLTKSLENVYVSCLSDNKVGMIR